MEVSNDPSAQLLQIIEMQAIQIVHEIVGNYYIGYRRAERFKLPRYFLNGPTLCLSIIIPYFLMSKFDYWIYLMIMIPLFILFVSMTIAANLKGHMLKHPSACGAIDALYHMPPLSIVSVVDTNTLEWKRIMETFKQNVVNYYSRVHRNWDLQQRIFMLRNELVAIAIQELRRQRFLKEYYILAAIQQMGDAEKNVLYKTIRNTFVTNADDESNI